MDLRDWYEKAQSEKTGIRTMTAAQANAYLDLLSVPVDPRKRLLEVNYCDGTFLEQALKRVDCTGIDNDHEHYKAAKQRLGEIGPGTLVECALLEMRQYPEKFHYIYMIGSVPTEEESSMIQALLRADGKYCVVTPNDQVVTGIREAV